MKSCQKTDLEHLLLWVEPPVEDDVDHEDLLLVGHGGDKEGHGGQEEGFEAGGTKARKAKA